MWEITNCKCCGAPLKVVADDVLKCEYCGVEYKLINSKTKEDLKRIENLKRIEDNIAIQNIRLQQLKETAWLLNQVTRGRGKG